MSQQLYGLYTKIRNITWNIFLDNHISSLPVDIVKIIQHYQITIIKNHEVCELKKDEMAVSLFEHNSNQWYIIYQNDTLSTADKRFLLAHELGHILLGHVSILGHPVRSNIKIREEKEADMFALRLLAPACVLAALNIHTAEQIMKLCNISKQSASIRAARMEELYKRDLFCKHPLEKQMLQQFEKFIQTYKNSD